MRSLLSFVLLFMTIGSFALDPILKTDTVLMYSNILHENRSYIIYSPNHINQHDSVIVLVMLDGEYANSLIEKYYQQNIGSTQNLITVAVLNTDRRRDMLYALGANNFLGFLTSELNPILEQKYNISSKILFGHSFSASFVLYSLLTNSGSFNTYIASSPTPIMDLVQKDKFILVDNNLKNNVHLFISYGSRDMAQVKKWAVKLISNLSEISFVHINWKSSVHEGKNHDNSNIEALFKGIDFVF